MTTRKKKPKFTLSKPEDMLAAIPHLLGFRPANSVVLLANAERGKQVGRKLRGDIPPDEAIVPFAQHMIESITADAPTSVLIVVVGGGRDADRWPPPYAALVRALKAELDQRSVPNPAALWVPEISEGARWRCYDHDYCTGVLPDPRSTVVAAELARLGQVTFNSREELAQLLRPDAAPVLRSRADLIDAKLSALCASESEEWSPQRGVSVVWRCLRASASGVLALSDDDLAEIGLALHDVRVRDACLATAVPADTDLATDAARLWQALTRSLPPPECAEAACLAGYAAYMMGDGAFAGMAFEVALATEPEHVLAGLLIRALDAGMHPADLHGLANHDEVGLRVKLGQAA